mmetsp:Transcript_60255/g.196988  ORF Transcript_60255/g.196988 Transcript_60255/m.196988 type:complete len:208 (+) Transcript_60255:658-1281(+)
MLGAHSQVVRARGLRQLWHQHGEGCPEPIQGVVQRVDPRRCEVAVGLEAVGLRSLPKVARHPGPATGSHVWCHGQLDPTNLAERPRLHGLRRLIVLPHHLAELLRGLHEHHADLLHPIAGRRPREGSGGHGQEVVQLAEWHQLLERCHGPGSGCHRDGKAGHRAQGGALGHVAEHPPDAEVVHRAREEAGRVRGREQPPRLQGVLVC